MANFMNIYEAEYQHQLKKSTDKRSMKRLTLTGNELQIGGKLTLSPTGYEGKLNPETYVDNYMTTEQFGNDNMKHKLSSNVLMTLEDDEPSDLEETAWVLRSHSSTKVPDVEKQSSAPKNNNKMLIQRPATPRRQSGNASDNGWSSQFNSHNHKPMNHHANITVGNTGSSSSKNMTYNTGWKASSNTSWTDYGNKQDWSSGDNHLNWKGTKKDTDQNYDSNMKEVYSAYNPINRQENTTSMRHNSTNGWSDDYRNTESRQNSMHFGKNGRQENKSRRGRHGKNYERNGSQEAEDGNQDFSVEQKLNVPLDDIIGGDTKMKGAGKRSSHKSTQSARE